MFISIQSFPLKCILNFLILLNIKESKQVVDAFSTSGDRVRNTFFILFFCKHSSTIHLFLKWFPTSSRNIRGLFLLKMCNIVLNNCIDIFYSWPSQQLDKVSGGLCF